LGKSPKKDAGGRSADILVLNGPNLNMLGEREPAIYGHETLDDIARAVEARAKSHGLTVDFRQSNFEGHLIGWLQEARRAHRGIVINPAGLGHTSIALLDAVIVSELPVIEVHLSTIFAREPFRHHSHISAAAKGVICGLGSQGYLFAVDALAAILGGGSKGRGKSKGRK
jgi:3-dehydroquinate dehydratase-2